MEGGGGGRTEVTDRPCPTPVPEAEVVSCWRIGLSDDKSNPGTESEVSLAVNGSGETEVLAATSKGDGGAGVPDAAGGGDVTTSVSSFTWGG